MFLHFKIYEYTYYFLVLHAIKLTFECVFASDSISMQQALCTAFLTRFDLTAAELAALAPPDPVTLVAASGTLPPLQPVRVT